MKQHQFRRTRHDVENYNGHMFASTWLQCAPTEGVGGPYMIPGGYSKIADVNKQIDQLHPDAGVRWWLDYIQTRYGSWHPPKPHPSN